MMKTALKLSILLLCIAFTGCKNEPQKTLEYTYTSDENPLTCENIDTKLFNEALLSFEDDITKSYSQGENTQRAYSIFMRNLVSNRVDFEEVASPHTMLVLEALKAEKDLWNKDNSLNYQASIFGCLTNNFKDKNLKTTFDALISTNSMSNKLMAAPIQNKIRFAKSDRYMATYVALDFYYSHLLDIDATKVKENTMEESTEQPSSNRVLPQRTKPTKIESSVPKSNEHEGHNH